MMCAPAASAWRATSALHRVDGERRRGARRQFADNRNDAAQFLFEGNRRGAGPGGFAADVEEVGALFDQLQSHGQRRRRRGELAAVGEAVRRDVDDAHDEGAHIHASRRSRQRQTSRLSDIRNYQGFSIADTICTASLLIAV